MSVSENEAHLTKAKMAFDSCERGVPAVYLYRSKALAARRESFFTRGKHKALPMSNDYEPNPWNYQYDLEVYIFLHYNDICSEEDALGGSITTQRHYHLLSAIRCRWPSEVMPDGSLKGEMVVNPWVVTKAKSVSEYINTLVMGGAGQGKTLFFISFLCIIFDHFIYTKRGAHCAFSTISKSKMTGTTWSHMTKLYPVQSNRVKFSSYAGLAVESADFQYKRVDPATGKRLDRGVIIGVLLSQGRKDTTQIDKLTGLHDPEAKVYLLDEAQSTDSTPIDAYTNMFLHPKFCWFFMLGNFSKDGDLLEINARPVKGWVSVNENTHRWIGSLKSHSSVLDLPISVIHLNNEKSPAIVQDPVRYKHCCPTIEKKNRNYQTEESKKSEAYKRFWIGFRFIPRADSSNIVIPYNSLKSFVKPAIKNPPRPIKLWSFDSAPGDGDRNILTLASLYEGPGMPIIQFDKFLPLPKAKSPMTYYKDTGDAIESNITAYGIEIGKGSKPCGIQDWSQRTQLIENLAERGIGCYALSYSEAIPKKAGPNKVTGVMEEPIELEHVSRFFGNFEKSFTVYAHQKVRSRIALGAYLFALFLEKGCIAGITAEKIEEASKLGIEKEICTRAFTNVNSNEYGQIFTLTPKEDFKDVHRFSPDIFDTICQMCYMIYAEMKVRTTTQNLDFLRNKLNNNFVDSHKKLWQIRERPSSLQQGSALVGLVSRNSEKTKGRLITR